MDPSLCFDSCVVVFVPGSKVPIKIVPGVDKTVKSPSNLQWTTVLQEPSTPRSSLFSLQTFVSHQLRLMIVGCSSLAPPTSIRTSKWLLPRSFVRLWGTSQSVTTEPTWLRPDTGGTKGSSPNQTTCRWGSVYGGTGCCCRASAHYLSSRQRWSDSASHPDLLCDDFMQVSLQSLQWIWISHTFEPTG